MKKPETKVKYSCISCDRTFLTLKEAESCYDSHSYFVKCNFCDKILKRDVTTNWVYDGNIFEAAVGYGSDLDGEYFTFAMCDECMKKYLVGKSCN